MQPESPARLDAILLSTKDVDDIFSLYTLAQSTSPYGFLAIRTKNDFREFFAKPDDVIAAGIRDNGRLIAYCICHRIAKVPYAVSPFLSLIDAAQSTVYHGDGTVVHPAYRGRMLTRRMSRLRWQQICARQIDHVLGLIAVDNTQSIGNAVLVGVLLTGFARDETSLNYVAYAGCLRNRLRTDTAPISVDCDDHELQRRLFAQGKVAYEFTTPKTRPADKRQFSFRPIE